MKRKLQRENKGFTIIEVLIVLAIAGLILLIVFLAVPALQRNSRNTQRRNDISNILAAVTEYSNNNQGKFPADATNFETAFPDSKPKIGYYTTPDNIDWDNQTAAGTGAYTPDLDTVVVMNFAKCADNNPTVTGATNRSVIALYTVEGSGGAKVQQCQES
jgi:prepilin-type N-terminal cleavage/methylation domain-containing protein